MMYVKESVLMRRSTS